VKAILENAQIRKLRESLVRSSDTEAAAQTVGELLRILEYIPSAGAATCCYMRSAATGGYFELEREEKIRFEIASWVTGIDRALRPGGDGSLLGWLSPNLCEICQSRPEESQVALARTLRMALLLQSLMLGSGCPSDHPYRSIWDLEEATAGKLRTLVENLKRVSVPLGDDEGLKGWSVSLPLLLVLAVAESQCEYGQPFAWEAYSAGRAHEELKRKWGAIDERVLNTATLLIRCQSVVGQRMRGTGGGRLLRLVKDSATELCFLSEQIYDALTLEAVIEEARNHSVPGETHKPGAYRSADARNPWGQPDTFSTQAALYLDFDPARDIDDEPTWQYVRPRYQNLNEDAEGEADTEAFKAIVKEQAEVQRRKLDHGWGDFEVVSIGQLQARFPLKALIGEIIRGWGHRPIKQRREDFSRFFDLRVIKVPNPLIADREERTLQVVLKDYLAARCLLFPGKEQKLALEGETKETAITPPDHTAGDLFTYLLGAAREPMSLEQDARWESSEDAPKPIYAPFPLIRRITGIINRLLPQQCFAIPLSIDRLPTEWIYIPHGIKKGDKDATRILANFLLATVLNRAMTAGLRYAEIDLQNLSKPQCSKEGWMAPADWQELVRDTYCNGGYETLLGRYLRDYNTQRDNVAFRARLARDLGETSKSQKVPRWRLERDSGETSESPKALAIGGIQKDLARYLEANGNPDFWLLGVDIGGTLTKCQLFRFKPSTQHLESAGTVFHMSTRLSRDERADLGKVQDTTERARKATTDFAARLVALVRKRSTTRGLPEKGGYRLVLGVTWPGPIRENHIAGTSGILEQFGLSRDMKKNRIEDIWEIDVAKAVGLAWEKACGWAPLDVSLLNDGDADAVGAVVGMEGLGAPSGDDSDPRVMSVVKLGTGLAGAVLDAERGRLLLRPGLFEWGKIILDLGGPRRKPFPQGGAPFPQGVAADYLSKRCLSQLASQLASRLGTGKFQNRDDPDSAEIGLILETAKMAKTEPPDEPLGRLLLECGALQAERRPPFGTSVSAEVFKLVYNDPEAEPDLIFEVRLGMTEYGDVKEVLRRTLDNLGRTRLGRLIGDLTTKGIGSTASAVVGANNFQRAAGIAADCVTTLGHYLGDFCLLLHEQLGVTEFRLGGGVLSGTTGEIAKEAACERVALYGLKTTPTEGTDTFLIEKARPGEAPDPAPSPPVAPGVSGAAARQPERGTFGAACFAAAAFLQEQKQEGLQKLRLAILPLPAGAQITVQRTTVSASAADEVFPLHFDTYALSEEELLHFMRTRPPEWRFYQTQDPCTFVKW